MLTLGIALLTSLALPRTSFAADDTVVAREHAQKGTAFMDLGKYTEAATEYEAAYAAKPDPALLLNLAQAYRLAGNADRALFFYRKYLQHVPKSPYRADIEEKIAALEKQSQESQAAQAAQVPKKAPSGTVSPPPASSVSSSFPSGATPVPQGPANGNQPSGPATAPASGATPYAGVPDGNPGNSVVAPNVMPPPSGGEPAPAPPSPVDHGQNLKLAGIVTGGAGVLSIVVGAVFGAQARNAAQKIETAAANGETYGPDLQSQDSRGRSAQTKEAVFLVVGVAAVAGGGFLYYYGGRQQRTAEAVARAPAGAGTGTVAILPAGSASQLGATLRVTF